MATTEPRAIAMISRPDALRIVDEVFAADPVVLTLGGTIREMLTVAGRKPNHLYVLDAMGLPAAIGLGIALGIEDDARHDSLVVVEGDGSTLMGFSALSTIGNLKPKKLVLLILDNGVYLATGGQPTAAATTDFVAVARACGWASASDIESTPGALRAALEGARTQDGPLLLRMRISTATIPTGFFLEDPVLLGAEFSRWLRAGVWTV
ncbi:MAG TPA: thiamine pyrophosphate-dependent enzyme [Thermomicrobiales bacterium]|jgi:thiamine pyrophosphate-dependent acetolactate synthase large subunit-like protein